MAVLVAFSLLITSLRRIAAGAAASLVEFILEELEAADRRDHARREPAPLPAAARLALPLHPRRQPVVPGAGHRGADGEHRDDRGAGRHRLLRRALVRRPRARPDRLSARIRPPRGVHDPAQHPVPDHAHPLAGRAPVRQHDERRFHRRHRGRAGRPLRADPVDGPGCADRCNSGLYLHGACRRVHRCRDRHPAGPD